MYYHRLMFFRKFFLRHPFLLAYFVTLSGIVYVPPIGMFAWDVFINTGAPLVAEQYGNYLF